jgi:hypothetical protein
MARSSNLIYTYGMTDKSTPPATPQAPKAASVPDDAPASPPKEIGGGKGPEPTRYGDWEVGGICSDF